jgi:hypothetical protein
VNKVVTLTHYERGPIDVSVRDEATFWMQNRQWSCPNDEELGTFDDGDFDETTEQIDDLLATATSIG